VAKAELALGVVREDINIGVVRVLEPATGNGSYHGTLFYKLFLPGSASTAPLKRLGKISEWEAFKAQGKTAGQL
jgi:hypothetical protein